MRRLPLWPLALLVLVPLSAPATLVDRGFTEQIFVDGGLQELTSLTWAPDGSNRLFITRKQGEIRIVENGVLRSTPWATVSPLHTAVESGLVGLAFDPDFATNHSVYVFATVSNTEQQILRYTDVGGMGTDKTVILAGLPTRGLNHNGGGIAFGPDGMLYFGVGDTGTGLGGNDDLLSLGSKIGRTRKDGTAPEDNPFFDGAGPQNDYIWARGVRNPFGLAFQPGTARLWVDVAGDVYEQVFSVQKGEHAGWLRYEKDQPEGFLPPVIKYRTNGAETLEPWQVGVERRNGVTTFTFEGPHFLRPGEWVRISKVSDVSFHGDFFVASVPTRESFTVLQPGASDLRGNFGMFENRNLGGSITGGAFSEGTALPPEYRGNYFFGDFNSGLIIRAAIGPDGNVSRVEPWAQDIHGAVDVAYGPDGALYYAEFYSGRIYRATYTGGERRILLSQTQLFVEEGSTTTFTVRLEERPPSNTQVFVSLYNGPDTELSVAQGEALTFTPDNYATPQTVTIAAGQDADAEHDTLGFFVGSAEVGSYAMDVQVLDDDGVDVVVSQEAVSLQESRQAWVDVSLARRPASSVTVAARVAEGKGVQISGSASVSFTPDNSATPQSLLLTALVDGSDTWDEKARVLLLGTGVRARWISVAVDDIDWMPPIFTSSPVRTAFVGVPYRYQVEAQALPAASLSLGLKPDGMSIDSETGLITWTPLELGTYEVSVVASNERRTGSLQGFTLSVVPAPVDAGPPDGGSSQDGGGSWDGGSQPGPDGGVSPPEDAPADGCGCTQGPASGLLLVGAFGVLLAQRRRRGAHETAPPV